MRKDWLSRAACGLVAAWLMASPQLAVNAMSFRGDAANVFSPRQSGANSKDPVKPKGTVLARNTNSGATTASATPKADGSTTAKKQNGHDKKTIGRCWKRLMDNVREVAHAHRNRQ